MQIWLPAGDTLPTFHSVVQQWLPFTGTSDKMLLKPVHRVAILGVHLSYSVPSTPVMFLTHSLLAVCYNVRMKCCSAVYICISHETVLRTGTWITSALCVVCSIFTMHVCVSLALQDGSRSGCVRDAERHSVWCKGRHMVARYDVLSLLEWQKNEQHCYCIH